MPDLPPQQLVLDVQLSEHQKFDNFICLDVNKALLTILQQFFQADQATQSIATQARHVFLHGTSAAGKTHLLQSICHLAQQENLNCILVSLKNVIAQPAAEVLKSLAAADVICIDDVQAIKDSAEWQQQLFHFYNRLQEHKKYLFFAANDVPDALQIELKDLVSRLKWGLTYRVVELDDSGLRELLKVHTLQRGIRLDEEVIDYIMLRAQRSTQALMDIINTLDCASWQSRRAITKPFIKETLTW